MGVPSEYCVAKPEQLTFNSVEELIGMLQSLEQSAQVRDRPVTFHGKIEVTGEGYINALVF